MIIFVETPNGVDRMNVYEQLILWHEFLLYYPEKWSNGSVCCVNVFVRGRKSKPTNQK